MLVIGRNAKTNKNEVYIEDTQTHEVIKLTVLKKNDHGGVRLGFEANKRYKIVRGELLEKMDANNDHKPTRPKTSFGDLRTSEVGEDPNNQNP